MYCRNCGSEISDWVKFCTKCGFANHIREVPPQSQPVLNGKIATSKRPVKVIYLLVIIIIGVVWGLLLFKPVVDKNLALEIYLIGTGVATLLMLLAGIVFIVKARQFKRRGGRH